MIENKPSSSHNFVRFLIRMCVMPLGVEDDKEEVTFKFMSMKTIVHFLIYFGLNIVFSLTVDLYTNLNKMTFSSAAKGQVESMVGNSTSILMTAVVFPILISAKLNRFPKRIILNKSSAWPRGMWKIILSSVLIFTGNSLYSCGFISEMKSTQKNRTVLSLINCSILFYNFLFWTLPAVILGIWMENLKAVSKPRGDGEEVKHTRFCLSSYKDLTRALGYFFCVYFGVIQIMLVTWSFSGLTQLLSDKALTLSDYLMVGGTFLAVSKLTELLIWLYLSSLVSWEVFITGGCDRLGGLLS